MTSDKQLTETIFTQHFVVAQKVSFPGSKQTLSRWWTINGTSPASITAWTCCWLPAVILDKNHTASCVTRQAQHSTAKWTAHQSINHQYSFNKQM